jgi:hypothetical protein
VLGAVKATSPDLQLPHSEIDPIQFKPKIITYKLKSQLAHDLKAFFPNENHDKF